jgi:hypothetical protein
MSPVNKGSIFNQVIDSGNHRERGTEQKKHSLNLISVDSSPGIRQSGMILEEKNLPTEDSPDHTKFDLMIYNNQSGETSVQISPQVVKEIHE